jgi:predicted RNase H-like HicB family nuclease
MEKEYTVIIEKDEDQYFVASVVELPGCHTQAKTLDMLMERIKEAILLYLEVEEEKDLPKLNFVGIQRVKIEA